MNIRDVNTGGGGYREVNMDAPHPRKYAPEDGRPTSGRYASYWNALVWIFFYKYSWPEHGNSNIFYIGIRNKCPWHDSHSDGSDYSMKKTGKIARWNYRYRYIWLYSETTFRTHFCRTKAVWSRLFANIDQMATTVCFVFSKFELRKNMNIFMLVSIPHVKHWNNSCTFKLSRSRSITRYHLFLHSSR